FEEPIRRLCPPHNTIPPTCIFLPGEYFFDELCCPFQPLVILARAGISQLDIPVTEVKYSWP
ncbi:MAG: hypothetical protein ABGX05_05210, partial [Pirellulaceae bacterium]